MTRSRYEDLREVDFLAGSDYLKQMYDMARNEDEVDCIKDHLEQHGVFDEWKKQKYYRLCDYVYRNGGGE